MTLHRPFIVRSSLVHLAYILRTLHVVLRTLQARYKLDARVIPYSFIHLFTLSEKQRPTCQGCAFSERLV